MSTEATTSSPITGWNLTNSYAELPDVFFEDVAPGTVRDPRVVVLNRPLAEDLGLSLDESDDAQAQLAQVFAGQNLPEQSRPIAQAYAGHQFGGFTMLGDGRAILLGEQRTPSGGLVDVQFKGSGRTGFSRRGDGRAALGPMLREYIISEAMFALGIPTTRSLAVVTTGDPVYRETALPGAVLTRIAASHIRVGTFEYLAARRDETNLRLFADYTIARHDPELVGTPDQYLGFLRAVIGRQVELITAWQLVGFIHGVMNTDNMVISGETIDYGPCAFMDAYDPATVFSSIDHHGRYAYGRQPAIGQWNLARFAETLLPLLDEDQDKAVEMAMELLNQYPADLDRRWLAGMRGKLGLESEEAEDEALVDELLEWMQAAQADYTNTFDALTEAEGLSAGIFDNERFKVWHTHWMSRRERDELSATQAYTRMRAANPAVIPRNHRVEDALTAATLHGDLSVMHRLLDALASPYERRPACDEYRQPRSSDLPPYQTFCGT